MGCCMSELNVSESAVSQPEEGYKPEIFDPAAAELSTEATEAAANQLLAV